MASTYKFYDVRVALFQAGTSLGSALYTVKARNEQEAKRKALKQAENDRNPSLFGPTFYQDAMTVREVR